MNTTLVSAVIVNYNNRKLCSETIESVLRQTHSPLEVIVVDNGSTDGSVAGLRAEYPLVRVLPLKKNHYFCGALNIGIRESHGDYLLLLNNDVVLSPKYVVSLLPALRADECRGAVTGKVLRRGSNIIDTTGMVFSRTLKPQERGYSQLDRGQFRRDGAIFGASLGAPLVKREMLESVAHDGEYLDEAFCHYYEDLDLYWRARRRGWKSHYVGSAAAYHERGATNKTLSCNRFFRRYYFPQLSPTMQADYIKNRYLTFLKNTQGWQRVGLIPFMLLYDILLWLYVVLFSPKTILQFFAKWRSTYPSWRKRWKE